MTLINTYKYHIAIVSCCYGIMFPLYHIASGRYDLSNSRLAIFNPKLSGFCVPFECKLAWFIWFVHNNYICNTHLPVTICVVSIGGSKGKRQGCAPSEGPNPFIFMQFLAKNLLNISTLEVGDPPPRKVLEPPLYLGSVITRCSY